VGPLISNPDGLINIKKLIDVTLERESGLSKEEIIQLRRKIFVTMEVLTYDKLKVKLFFNWYGIFLFKNFPLK